MTDIWDDAEIISTYTREQAIEDGVLVDVSGTAREAGYKFPVAITHALNVILTPSKDDKCLGQDYPGRLWDVFSVLNYAIRSKPDADVIEFRVIVRRANVRKTCYTLQAWVTPGDHGEPVITIGLPGDF